MKFEKATKEMMDESKTRNRWPYADMDVGDMVYIRHGQYGKSRVDLYAHVYGRQRGWKFATKRMPDGVYRIIRIA